MVGVVAEVGGRTSGAVPAVFDGAGVVGSPQILNLRAGLSASSRRSGPHTGRCFGHSVSALQGVTHEKSVAADPWSSRSPGLHEATVGLAFTQTSGPFGVVEPVHDCPAGHGPRPDPQICRHFWVAMPPSTSVSLTESWPGLQPLGSRFGSAEGSAVALEALAAVEGVATGAAAPASTAASLLAPSFGQPTRSADTSSAATIADLCMVVPRIVPPAAKGCPRFVGIASAGNERVRFLNTSRSDRGRATGSRGRPPLRARARASR